MDKAKIEAAILLDAVLTWRKDYPSWKDDLECLKGCNCVHCILMRACDKYLNKTAQGTPQKLSYRAKLNQKAW